MVVGSNARPPLVILPREIGQVPPPQALVGQKARGLAQLAALKTRVPRFGILTAEAFDAHTSQDDVQAVVAAARAASTAQGGWSDDGSRVAHGEAMVRAVLRNALPVSVRIGVHELLSAFAEEDQLAVRASVVGEPLEATVLSGALDSALGVKGKEALEEALLRIMALAFHPRTLGLRESAGLAPIGCRLAVVVQRMVSSESSGVCVSLEQREGSGDVFHPKVNIGSSGPITGVGGPTCWIRGCYGLAGGIGGKQGSARIPSDVIRVVRTATATDGVEDDAVVAMESVTKETALKADDTGTGRGARMQTVSEHLKRDCCISAVQARMIAREALRLEAAFGKPQVISWAFAGRLLHILDVEPLLVPVSRIESERARTWDARLLPAGLSSHATPLTFSVWQRAAARGVERAGRLLGVKGVILEDTRPQMPRLVGHVAGRVYGNVEVLTALLDLLPFADKARAAIASSTGQAELLPRRAPPPGFWQRQRQKLDEGRWSSQLEKISELARTESERFRGEVEQTLDKYRDPLGDRARSAEWSERRPMHRWDPDALIDAFDDLQDALSKCVAALALSGVSAALHRVELDAVVEETPLKDSPWLVSDLLGGEIPGDLVELTRRVVGIVELVRKRPTLRAIVDAAAEGGLEALAARLLSPDAARTSAFDDDERRLSEELRAVVTSFPASCTGDLTLDAARMTERPEVILHLVVRLLDTDVTSSTLDTLARSAAGARKKAEYALETGGGTGSWLRSSVKKRLLAELEAVRLHGRDTALLFIPTERVVDTLRRVALALGERLFEHGLLDQPRDVLHLTTQEISGFVRGTGVDLDGKPLVAARKRQAAARPSGLPRRLETKGVVAGARLDDDDDDDEQARAPTSPGEARELLGRAVSARVVTAPAMLLHDPLAPPSQAARRAPDGVVLVKHLTLRDLPLFLAARAVVAERGTQWSAAAYALRALGIPTVVDAPQAMSIMARGEVTVDAGKGLVSRAAPARGAKGARDASGTTQRPPATDVDGVLFAREAVLSDPRGRFIADRPAPNINELPPPPLMRPAFMDQSRIIAVGRNTDEATDIDDSDIVMSTDLEKD